MILRIDAMIPPPAAKMYSVLYGKQAEFLVF